MEKNNKSHTIISGILKAATWKLTLILLLFVAAVLALYKTIHFISETSSPATITKEEKTSMSLTQIRAIEDIGEWEFLTINDEEIIDTVRHEFFGDAELVRIYYGTLRLGIDLQEAGKGWIKTKGDSIIATLPPIKLLDNDFIDEARTRSFIESGSWTHADREALYQRAAAVMRKRCLTTSNIKSAQSNASRQFANLLRSMGYDNVSIRFEARR